MLEAILLLSGLHGFSSLTGPFSLCVKDGFLMASAHVTCHMLSAASHSCSVDSHASALLLSAHSFHKIQ